MNIEQVKELILRQQLKTVNFIESGHAPFVVEVEYIDKDDSFKALLKNDDGVVTTFRNIKECYDICSAIDIHAANLIQIETDDEVSTSDYASYHRESIPLTF